MEVSGQAPSIIKALPSPSSRYKGTGFPPHSRAYIARTYLKFSPSLGNRITKPW